MKMVHSSGTALLLGLTLLMRVTVMRPWPRKSSGVKVSSRREMLSMTVIIL